MYDPTSVYVKGKTAIIRRTIENNTILYELQKKLGLNKNVSELVFVPESIKFDVRVEQGSQPQQQPAKPAPAVEKPKTEQKSLSQEPAPAVEKSKPEQKSPTPVPVVEKPEPGQKAPPPKSEQPKSVPVIEKPKPVPVIEKPKPEQKSPSPKPVPVIEKPKPEQKSPSPEVQPPKQIKIEPSEQKKNPVSIQLAPAKPQAPLPPVQVKNIDYQRKDKAELESKYQIAKQGASMFTIVVPNFTSPDQPLRTPCKIDFMDDKIKVTKIRMPNDTLEYILSFFKLEKIRWDYKFIDNEPKILNFLNTVASNKWNKPDPTIEDVSKSQEFYADLVFSPLKSLKESDFTYSIDIADEKKLSLFISLFSTSVNTKERGLFTKNYCKQPTIYTVSIVSRFQILVRKVGPIFKVSFADTDVANTALYVKLFNIGLSVFDQGFEMQDYNFVNVSRTGGDESTLSKIVNDINVVAVKTDDVIPSDSQFEEKRSFTVTAFMLPGTKDEFEHKLSEGFGWVPQPGRN